MTDMINFQSFPKGEEAEEFVPTVRPVQSRTMSHPAIGKILEIGGGGGKIQFDARRLVEIVADPDPAISISGQVGGHVKLQSGQRWLLANIRGLRLADGVTVSIVAEIDFIG